MPVVDIKLNLVLSEAAVAALAADISAAIAGAFDGSCPSVMVCVDQGVLFVNATPAPAAWVLVRSAMDLSIAAKRRLCQHFSEILCTRHAIAPERVFLQMSRILPEDAWNLSASGPTCVADRTTRLTAHATSATTT